MQENCDTIEFYQKEVDNGDPEALFNIGICYSKGQGVEQNFSKATECYHKSAGQGNCYALYDLGFCYDKGQGVEQNYAKDLEFFKKNQLNSEIMKLPWQLDTIMRTD